jgi:hypothetical protein
MEQLYYGIIFGKLAKNKAKKFCLDLSENRY